MKDIVKIRIGVVPVFDNNPTKYKILVDNTLLFESNSEIVSGQPQHHDLTVELAAGKHNLDLRVEPTGLQFENIEVIDLAFNNQKLRDADLFLMSEYILDQPRMIHGEFEHKIDQCRVMVSPGVYRVSFTTPIMAWIIRNF